MAFFFEMDGELMPDSVTGLDFLVLPGMLPVMSRGARLSHGLLLSSLPLDPELPGQVSASSARLSVSFPTRPSDPAPDSGGKPPRQEAASQRYPPGVPSFAPPWFPGWGHAEGGGLRSGSLLFQRRGSCGLHGLQDPNEADLARGQLALREAVVTARLQAQGITDPGHIEAALPRIRWWRI